jgi:hypothetical protein
MTSAASPGPQGRTIKMSGSRWRLTLTRNRGYALFWLMLFSRTALVCVGFATAF